MNFPRLMPGFTRVSKNKTSGDKDSSITREQLSKYNTCRGNKRREQRELKSTRKLYDVIQIFAECEGIAIQYCYSRKQMLSIERITGFLRATHSAV